MSQNKTGRDLLRTAKEEFPGVPPEELSGALADSSPVLVDVREGEEWRAGHLPGAIHLPRGFLELQVDQKLPDLGADIVLYCAGGNRSALAAVTLREIGYSNVRHMAGGFTAWKDGGFEVVVPKQWSPTQRDRYSRHFVLPEVGEDGQAAISDSSVLVVGAGGLGSPALYYLAAAGVGRLGIVDFDSVEENNLQRQIIHSTERIGTNKALSAKQTIEGLNPDVSVSVFTDRLEEGNVDSTINEFDVIIDATDNFSTRYMLNDAAVRAGKPYIYGSIFRFEGYLSVFWSKKDGPCYRCMHPEPPPASLAPT